MFPPNAGASSILVAAQSQAEMAKSMMAPEPQPDQARAAVNSLALDSLTLDSPRCLTQCRRQNGGNP
jgi:hypothetical protein